MAFTLTGVISNISANNGSKEKPPGDMPASAAWIDPSNFPFFANVTLTIPQSDMPGSMGVVNCAIPIRAADMATYAPGTKLEFPLQVVAA